jgi:hypothetical protein
MNRAAKRGWFVVCACAGALAAAGAACSTVANSNGRDADSGSTQTQPAEDDASLGEAGGDFSLDGALQLLVDSTLPETSDDATTTKLDTGTCQTPASGDPCGLDPQCGCTSVQTCDINLGGTSCVAAGNAKVGHGCTTTASCEPGLTCFNGVCRPYCSNSGDAGCDSKLPEGGTCTAVLGDDGGPLASDDVCTFRCQLQDPNACGPTGDLNAGCIYDGVGGTDCEAVGLSNIGDDCTYLNDCKPGLVCVGQCLPWCRVGHSPSDCGDGEACQAFASPVPTAYGVEYGYCP